MNSIDNIAKNAKIIGVGDEGINTLDTIINKVENSMDFEKININQDVDKDYVRNLLDGVDVLFLTYSTENRRANDIVKAIAYMSDERRVLSIGLNSSDKEVKEESAVNREFKICSENIEKIIDLMNMMMDSISESCMINIDLTDLKEILARDKGLKYSYDKFGKEKNHGEKVKIIIDNISEIGNEFISKNGILFIEMGSNYCEKSDVMIALNEILTKAKEELDDTYNLIFSLYIKEKLDDKIRIGLICN